jgi:hypothetical protein
MNQFVVVFLSDILFNCVPVWDGIVKTLEFSRGLSPRNSSTYSIVGVSKCRR